MSPPRKELTAWAMRREVVKSGLRSDTFTDSRCDISKGSSRSTMAPLAMRPAVGTPLVTDEPEAPEAVKPPVAT